MGHLFALPAFGTSTPFRPDQREISCTQGGAWAELTASDSRLYGCTCPGVGVGHTCSRSSRLDLWAHPTPSRCPGDPGGASRGHRPCVELSTSGLPYGRTLSHPAWRTCLPRENPASQSANLVPREEYAILPPRTHPCLESIRFK